ncbi:MAG: hypothetical protein IJE43_08000 [Alphaproteobacteria bacterium]|nr:hypothetical protein [Alphaproteobacteria bacterium]
MGRRNRECYLCGKDYSYCPTCSQDKMKPAWMAEFHSASCKNIFDICTRFNMGLMTKAEAREALNACDLSNKANFKSYVQHDLEVIFAEEPKKKTKKIEAQIIEEPTVAPEAHEVVEKENE